MSDFENPYVSPETQVAPEAAQNSGVQFTVNMLQYLYDASPWLRFIGILGYIGAGLTALSGLIAFIAAIAADSYFDGLSGMLGFAVLFYLPAGVLMFFPAHFAFKFGQKINSYKFTNSADNLEEALKYNKSYWKFTGILYIISLSLIPVFIIGAIIIGVIAAFGF